MSESELNEDSSLEDPLLDSEDSSRSKMFEHGDWAAPNAYLIGDWLPRFLNVPPKVRDLLARDLFLIDEFLDPKAAPGLKMDCLCVLYLSSSLDLRSSKLRLAIDSLRICLAAS